MNARAFLAAGSKYKPTSDPSDAVRFESIIGDGLYHGMLVQSPLERVALFSWKRVDLTLSDLTCLRHVLTRFQARRAVLYVPADILIPSSLLLLATLSKIAVIREEPVTV